MIKITEFNKAKLIENLKQLRTRYNEYSYIRRVHTIEEIDFEIKQLEALTANEYQELAAKTMNTELTVNEQQYHALHGMVGEIGEIHSIFQKAYQGHVMDREHIKKELGDLLWFIAEFCTVGGVTLEEIMRMNIDKLKKRYPDGFKEENSLNRKKGDI